MSIEETIKRLAREMAIRGRSPDRADCTAELLDESDEDGIVVISDADGHPLVYMPRAQYEAIRKLKLEEDDDGSPR